MKLLTVLSIFLLFSSSCRKCIQCSYTFNGETYGSGEICGNKKEIIETEEKWAENAKVVGSTSTCTDTR